MRPTITIDVLKRGIVLNSIVAREATTIMMKPEEPMGTTGERECKVDGEKKGGGWQNQECYFFLSFAGRETTDQ